MLFLELLHDWIENLQNLLLKEFFRSLNVLFSCIFNFFFNFLLELLFKFYRNRQVPNCFLSVMHHWNFKSILASSFKIFFFHRKLDIILQFLVKDRFAVILNFLTLLLTHVIPSILNVRDSTFINCTNVWRHNVTIHVSIELFSIESFDLKSLCDSFSKLNDLFNEIRP